MSLSEIDVAAMRERLRQDSAIQLRRAAVGVYAHAAKIGAKPLLHEAAHILRQWLPARLLALQFPAERWPRIEGLCARCGGFRLHCVVVIRFLGLTLHPRCDGGSKRSGLNRFILSFGKPLHRENVGRGCGWRLHHLRGDVVGFLFVAVVRGANDQAGLDAQARQDRLVCGRHDHRRRWAGIDSQSWWATPHGVRRRQRRYWRSRVVAGNYFCILRNMSLRSHRSSPSTLEMMDT